jgi:outer membrane lipoprotein SlyB
VAGSRIETRVDLTRSYEFTVRLADGSSRVFNDTNPARWRSGERVIVIDGANPSNK